MNALGARCGTKRFPSISIMGSVRVSLRFFLVALSLMIQCFLVRR